MFEKNRSFGEITMLLNGISIQGTYHSKNQDGFCAKRIENSYVLAVSDGLGSKAYSEVGSKALCDSICEVVEENIHEIDKWSVQRIVESTHEKWLKKLANYNVVDCYATMLILLILPNRIVGARLGDGFISVWIGNEIKVLFDQKDTYYANETDCLNETITSEKIEYLDIPYRRFRGAILCSDGVGIGDMTFSEIAHFTEDFIEEYCTWNENDLMKEIGGWLAEWTGTDDKTLVFAMEG